MMGELGHANLICSIYQRRKNFSRNYTGGISLGLWLKLDPLLQENSGKWLRTFLVPEADSDEEVVNGCGICQGMGLPQARTQQETQMRGLGILWPPIHIEISRLDYHKGKVSLGARPVLYFLVKCYYIIWNRSVLTMNKLLREH